MATNKIVLHVGCGLSGRERLHPAVAAPNWREVRLDIDPVVKPEIVADITKMTNVRGGVADAIFSSHNLEHLYAHQVDLALKEFRRVLKPHGFVILYTPDLLALARRIAEDKLDDPIYVSRSGPITPLDSLYGFRPMLAKGKLNYAHHMGFTAKTLRAAFLASGFADAAITNLGEWDLVACAWTAPGPCPVDPLPPKAWAEKYLAPARA